MISGDDTEKSTFDRILIGTANIRLSMAYVEFKNTV